MRSPRWGFTIQRLSRPLDGLGRSAGPAPKVDAHALKVNAHQLQFLLNKNIADMPKFPPKQR